MNLMIRKKSLFTRVPAFFLMTVLTVLLLAGCSRASEQQKREKQYARGSSAFFLKLAAQDITTRKDTGDLFYKGDNLLVDFDAEPVLQPYFALLNFKAKVDPDDPELVRYSCKVPGLTGACLNATYNTCFSKVEEISPWVDVEGTVRIVKGEDGKRRIDVSGGDNIFAAYAQMRYGKPDAYTFQGIDLTASGVTRENRAKVQGIFIALGCPGYAKTLGRDYTTYLQEVVWPEFDKFQEIKDKIDPFRNNRGYGMLNLYNSLPGIVKGIIEIAAALLFLVLLIVILVVLWVIEEGISNRWDEAKNLKKLYPADAARRKEMKKLLNQKKYRDALFGSRPDVQATAIWKLSWNQDRQILEYLAQTRSNHYVLDAVADRLPYPKAGSLLIQAAEKMSNAAVRKLPYPQERETLVKLALHGTETSTRIITIEKLPYPEEKETIKKVAQTAKDKKLRKTALEKLAGSGATETMISIFREEKDEKEKLELLKKIEWRDESRSFFQDLALKSRDINLRETAALKLVYPDCRDLLLQLLEKDEIDSVRLAALGRLPMPEEKETISQTAISDPDSFVRRAALKKLTYPDNRETLLRAAAEDEYEDNRVLAMERLPLSQEREAVERFALNDPEAKARRVALDRLKTRKSREAVEKAALEDTDSFNRLHALKKLTYMESKATLRRIALEDKEKNNRETALNQLLNQREKKTLENVAKKDEDKELRAKALKQLSYPASRKALVYIATHDTEEDLKRTAMDQLPWIEEPEAWGHFMTEPSIGSGRRRTGPTEDERLKGAISLARHLIVPSDKILRKLCTQIQDGISSESGFKTLSIAGWSAAALGRIITAQMKPEDIAPNQKCLAKAIDRHNETLGKIRELQEMLKPYEGRKISDLYESERNSVEDMINTLDSYRYEIGCGLGWYMVDNGDRPFAYLTHIMRDSQSRVPRFIKQGVIMGLVDWLTDNADHPEAKKLLETLIAVRADLIRSDNDLSFYELRVPSDCPRDTYAVLLADVLHCANPSVNYCDTDGLLSIAEEEVPGCMDMLRVCPLRLIDPVNRQTLGFYKFNPYVHAMWTQYQPPLNTGKVISRYHEVDDRTKPLSSGLNLQLFRDPYGVIPTIFHEYQHFRGDPNEASVFLKTQLFSIRFYKKYRSANAKADGVFAQMTNMLGLPPAAEKIGALNNIIRQCYGEQLPRSAAEAHANAQLDGLNKGIMNINNSQTWDKNIRYPLFTEGEDEKDRDLIREIIVRFDTVPKSITTIEFYEILNSSSPVNTD